MDNDLSGVLAGGLSLLAWWSIGLNFNLVSVIVKLLLWSGLLSTWLGGDLAWGLSLAWGNWVAVGVNLWSWSGAWLGCGFGLWLGLSGGGGWKLISWAKLGLAEVLVLGPSKALARAAFITEKKASRRHVLNLFGSEAVSLSMHAQIGRAHV